MAFSLLQLSTVTCSCNDCKSMCEHRPCWHTPQEAEIIIKDGYGDKLMLDLWASDKGDIQLLSPAIKNYESKMAPMFPEGTCTFLEKGLCKIHNIKPIEGRVTLGCKKQDGYKIHKAVAMLWKTSEAKKVVASWKKKYLK